MEIFASLITWMRAPANANLAAWAQGIGSIVAVIIAFAVPMFQWGKESRTRREESVRLQLAHAASFRAISMESEEAVSDLVASLKQPMGLFRMYGGREPQRDIFFSSIEELMPRISGLAQQVGLSEGQIGSLSDIRRHLNEIRVLLDQVNNPSQHLDLDAISKLLAISAKLQQLSEDAQLAYTRLDRK